MCDHRLDPRRPHRPILRIPQEFVEPRATWTSTCHCPSLDFVVRVVSHPCAVRNPQSNVLTFFASWWFQGLIFTGFWVIGHEVRYSTIILDHTNCQRFLGWSRRILREQVDLSRHRICTFDDYSLRLFFENRRAKRMNSCVMQACSLPTLAGRSHTITTT